MNENKYEVRLTNSREDMYDNIIQHYLREIKNDEIVDFKLTESPCKNGIIEYDIHIIKKVKGSDEE